jgi:N-acyl-D-aspartate/D-glutamate deacylase
MLDLALRNARIVDGTGRPAAPGAIGVRDGRIAAVGAVDEAASREVDVGGLTVMPGVLDLHAHYDAQLFWDPALSPSPLHGVTTVVAGNCGLTLAPAKPEDRDFLTRLLARVEAIPVEALLAGVEYRWETFPEFLDVVEASPLGPNIGFMVGHSAIRRAVMGEGASSEKASEPQLAAMRQLLSEAIAAGGLGFSTANVATQVDGDGRPTPPNFAAREEFVALAEVCGWHPGTCIEFIPGSFLVGFSDDDIELMAAMSAAANRHLNWNTPLVTKASPEMYRRQVSATDTARERGGWVVPMYMAQNGPTQQDFLRGYVYRALPGWGFLFAMGPDDRIKAMADPAVRARLVAALEAETRGLAVTMRTSWGNLIVNDVGGGGPKELEGRRVHDVAVERGVTDFDAICDIAVACRLDVGFVRYAVGAEDEWAQSARLELLRDPRVVIGASDAGAHMDMMVGADFPTRCMAELVRERGVFTLEALVHQVTDRLARLYGIRHRGRVEEGYWADLVVFDPETVGAGPLRTVRDLPAGAPRLKTESTGVHSVLVAGEAVVEDGKLTGATPGRLLRSGRDTDTVPARPAGS